ncbi:MAG: hypothetical protein H8E36_10825, partial [Rhodospirillaceae bacterium]|nr:hypothetical protein [Rhodospirillaceae bacterium]
MKKQTRKQKVYALRRRMKLNARRIKHSIKLKHYRIYGDRLSKRPSIGEGRRVKLQVPESLSLETHYDEVIALVEGIREHGVRKENKPFINFEKLRNVGPCGALLLAAELDRWRTVRGFRHEVFPKKWDPEVLRLMDEMGLFEILNVANPPLIKPPETGDMRFIRFRSHAETIGESASDMAAEIEAMAGAIPRWNKLFAGLTEAMTNVSNHAYPKDVDYKTQPLMKKWWMAGSFNSKTNRIMIIFYDQGVGIPVTLPRKHKKEKVRKALCYL